MPRPQILDKIAHRYPMLGDEPAGGGGGVIEPDDPTLPDEDEFELPPLDDDPAPDPTPPPADPVPPVASLVEPTPPAEKMHTQAELERILGERLARERRQAEEEKAQIRAQYERETLQRQQEAQAQAQAQQHWASRHQGLVRRMVDVQGYDEQAAQAMATEQVESEIRMARLEQTLVQQAQAQALAAAQNQQMVRYQQEKAAALAADPLAQMYQNEIEGLAQGGAAFAWGPAYAAVIAHHGRTGDLAQKLTLAAQQKQLANLQRTQKKGGVAAGTQTGGDNQPTLTVDQRRVARAMGLSDKEYAAYVRPKK